MTAYSGVISLTNGNGNFVRLNGSTGSPLATWNLLGNPIDLNVRSGATVITLGGLSGVAGSTLSGRGGSSNNGPTTMHIGANGLNTTFDGIIQNGGGGTSALTHVVKTGPGTLTLSGGNSYTGTTVVSNGVLALTGSGSIGTTPTITINSGAAIDVSGRGDTALNLGSGQTLRGDGTIRGNLDTTTGGTVSPGAAVSVIGQLTVTNIATLGGTIIMDLNRTNGVMTNDVLSAASIVLGGTLTVTNRGPNLVAGDRFVLFNGPVTGSFSTVNLPGNLGSVTYTWTNNTAVDGSIQVLTVVSVNPNPTNLVATVSGSTLTLSWPADHTGWRLQAQTNNLSTGLTGTWTDIPGTGTSNTFNATLDPANGTVFYRMVYP
jgi:autotransporter-associated beta strand protein